MNRRNLFKASCGAMLASSLGGTRLFAAPSDYNGEFLIQIQVGGAWDVSSYCDPKMNEGDKIINNWAKTDTIKSAGNIKYAPFANNAEMFNAHFDKMLVINGVNSFTNGHDAGKKYNFTGSTQAGYPSLSAAFAATRQADFPMPCLMNGSNFYSGNIIVPTRVGNDIATFNTLLEPNDRFGKSYITQEDETLISEFRNERAKRALAKTDLPAKRKLLNDFLAANKEFPSFNKFKEVFEGLDLTGFEIKTSFQSQVLYSMVAFKAGISVAADTVMKKFDTHSDHDNRQAVEMTTLNDGIMLMWHLAQQLDIADKLNVFIASDFGRTPYYNAGGGKDHWPVGSSIIMKKGVNWTNAMVGETDATQKSIKLNPATLTPDTNGVTIEPKHVMKFARNVLQIDDDPILSRYDLRVDDDYMDFSGGFYS